MSPSSTVSAPRSTWQEWLLLGLSLALASGMWLYSQWVMIPAERAHYAAMGQPADVGDLYPRWYGTRELLLHHRDPYSREVSREIQVEYYGRPLDTEGVDRGRDEQRFVCPVYVVFFLAPTVWLSFAETQIVARFLLALLGAGSLLFWLRALRWRLSRAVTLTLVTLFLSSPPMVQALRLQQLAVLVAFCLAGCAALVVRGRLVWAGALLACTTLKPQLALLPILWFLIWVAGDWKKRQGLVWGLLGVMGLLVAAGQLLLPGWVSEFVLGLFAYRHYAGMNSWLDLLLTRSIATPVAGVLLGLLLVACVRWRSVEADGSGFLLTLSIVLAGAVITFPIVPPFNHIFLVPGVLLAIRYWKSLWDRGQVVRLVCCLGLGIAAASWVAASVLAGVVAIAPGLSLTRVWELPLRFSFGIPPIVAGLLLVLMGDLAAQTRAPGPTRS